MAKVEKTWDTRECIRDTEMGKRFYCGCLACTTTGAANAAKVHAELRARQEKVATKITAYWVGDFSGIERDLAISTHRAGYDEVTKRCDTCGKSFVPGIGERRFFCNECC